MNRITSTPLAALLVSARLITLPSPLEAQVPVPDPGFESTLSYAGGVVQFTAQPGYFHRLWYNHGVSNDGNGNATLLWTLLPEQQYGTGQNVAWRLHGDMTPVPQGGGGTSPPATPLIMRNFHLRAFDDGGTLIQWWSRPLDRMQRAWVPVTASPNLSLRKPGNPPAGIPFWVHTGLAFWTDNVPPTGVTTARLYWCISASPGFPNPALQVNDYDPSNSPCWIPSWALPALPSVPASSLNFPLPPQHHHLPLRLRPRPASPSLAITIPSRITGAVPFIRSSAWRWTPTSTSSPTMWSWLTPMPIPTT